MKPNLKSTFFSLLGYGTNTTVAPTPLQMEVLKHAMLETLGEVGRQNHPRLVRQIRYAADAEGLWYARSDLMQALSEIHGETLAELELRRVSALFTDHLPSALTRRSSRPRH